MNSKRRDLLCSPAEIGQKRNSRRRRPPNGGTRKENASLRKIVDDCNVCSARVL